jgi:hypothetical protein
LLDDRNDDEGPDGIGRGQLVERRVFGRPMGRRIELRAELVGLERVLRRLEAVLLISVDLARLRIALDVRAGLGRGERGSGEARPARYLWRDGVGQIDIFGALQALLVDRLQPVAFGRAACARGHDCKDR